MSDWADMEMELGWDGGDIPDWDEPENEVNEDKNSNSSDLYVFSTDQDYDYLSFALTPASFLKEEDRKRRLSVMSSEPEKHGSFFIEHETDNAYDKLALKVFYRAYVPESSDWGAVHLGYVRKNFVDEKKDLTDIVNDFCFIKEDWQELDVKGSKYFLKNQISADIKNNTLCIRRPNAIKEKEKDIAREQERIAAEKERLEATAIHTEYVKNRQIEGFENCIKTYNKVLNTSSLFSWMKMSKSQAREGIEICSYNIKILKNQPFGVYDQRQLKS